MSARHEMKAMGAERGEAHSGKLAGGGMVTGMSNIPGGASQGVERTGVGRPFSSPVQPQLEEGNNCALCGFRRG